MWVVFHDGFTAVPYVSYADARSDGTHTDWSPPLRLPLPPHSPQGATYLLPHVAPDGTVYTPVTNELPRKGFCCFNISMLLFFFSIPPPPRSTLFPYTTLFRPRLSN